jgi:adhesin transport system outer membrane protein
MPNRILFLLWAFAGALAPAQGQTLEEAIHLMLSYEPELLAAHADTHSAAADINVVRGDLLPQVSLNGSGGSVERQRTIDGLSRGDGETLFARTIGISLRQLVFDGGNALYATRSAEHALAVQSYMERSMIEARVVDLSEVYFEVLRTAERIREAEANVATHERIRQQVSQRSGVGGTRTDTNLADSRLLEAKNTFVTEQIARQTAIDRFERLTGHKVDSLVLPRVPVVPPEMTAVDLSGNWNYLSAQSALRAVEDKRKAADRSGLPKVFLDAGLSRGEDLGGIEGVDDEARALLMVQWNLMNGGSRDALQKREGWQVVRAHELVRAADLERRYRLIMLWREREADRDTAASLQTQVDFLKQVANDYESQFAVGKRDLLDILDAWNRHYMTKVRLIDSSYNLVTGACRIQGVQGKLVEFYLGRDGWNELLAKQGKSAIPHPHHPNEEGVEPLAAELDPPQSGVEAPTAAKKGFFAKMMPDKHTDSSPAEPPAGLLPVKGQPVSTTRPIAPKNLR